MKLLENTQIVSLGGEKRKESCGHCTSIILSLSPTEVTFPVTVQPLLYRRDYHIDLLK